VVCAEQSISSQDCDWSESRGKWTMVSRRSRGYILSTILPARKEREGMSGKPKLYGQGLRSCIFTHGAASLQSK
jgi:hypothetical protein